MEIQCTRSFMHEGLRTILFERMESCMRKSKMAVFLIQKKEGFERFSNLVEQEILKDSQTQLKRL